MQVKCPTCQADVVWHSSSTYRPFCSKRCQLIDLGQWSDEQHVIQDNSPQQAGAPTAMDIEEIEALLMQQPQDFFNS